MKWKKTARNIRCDNRFYRQVDANMNSKGSSTRQKGNASNFPQGMRVHDNVINVKNCQKCNAWTSLQKAKSSTIYQLEGIDILASESLAISKLQVLV